MTTVKKVDIMSAAKIEAIICAIFGLILGIIVALFSGLLGSVSGSSFGNWGLGSIIIMPIIYAVIGFISGAIGAALYNLAAGWIGGIQIELEEKK